MDKIQKAIVRLSLKEREQLRIILQKVCLGQTMEIDITKLKGHIDIYRIRKGKLRIIFRVHRDDIYLLKIDRQERYYL